MSIETEPIRRGVASVLQWGGWLGSLGVIIWATVNFDPSDGKFAPQWVGLSVIFMVGVSIAATSARARMRLSDTILGAFKAGLETGQNGRNKFHHEEAVNAQEMARVEDGSEGDHPGESGGDRPNPAE